MSDGLTKQISEILEIIRKKWLGLSILIVLAVLLLAIAVSGILPSDSKFTDITANLTSEVIGFILIFLVFERGIERIRKLERFNIVSHSGLNFQDFLDEVSRAEECVRLLDSYTYLIQPQGREDNWPEFQKAITSAVKVGTAEIQILLCDPREKGMKKRAEDIVASKFTDDTDAMLLRRKCHKDLGRLHHFIGELRDEFKSVKIEVRLLDDLPSITLHRADNTSYWSFFPLDKPANKDDNLEVETKTRFGQYLDDRFNDLWHRGSGIISLDQYMGEFWKAEAEGKDFWNS